MIDFINVSAKNDMIRGPGGFELRSILVSQLSRALRFRYSQVLLFLGIEMGV
jgi:hypothetical protein